MLCLFYHFLQWTGIFLRHPSVNSVSNRALSFSDFIKEELANELRKLTLYIQVRFTNSMLHGKKSMLISWYHELQFFPQFREANLNLHNWVNNSKVAHTMEVLEKEFITYSVWRAQFMAAIKAIYVQLALMWHQVAQNKSDVQFIIKIHCDLFM